MFLHICNIIHSQNFIIMKVIPNIKENEKQLRNDLKQAFNDVRLFEEGKKKLKSIKQLLREL